MSSVTQSPPAQASELREEQILRFLGGMWQLQRRIKADVIPLLEPFDLDLRLYFILQLIRRGVVYPKDIACQLDLPASLLSRYLEQLRRSGYIERQLDLHDSRRIVLQLTPAGEQVLQDAIQAILGSTSERLRHLDPERLSALLDAIELLSELDLSAGASPSSPSSAPKEQP